MSRDIDLSQHSLRVVCQFAGDAERGLHVWLKDCSSGTLVKTPIDGVESAWSGTDNSGGWKWNDRSAPIVMTVYYPGPVGNSVPESVKYSADPGDTFALATTIKIGLSEFGQYQVCFNLGGQKEVVNWRPGYQYKNDPTQPDPTCQEFRVQKEGFL